MAGDGAISAAGNQAWGHPGEHAAARDSAPTPHSRRARPCHRVLRPRFPVRFGAMTHPTGPAFARLRRDLMRRRWRRIEPRLRLQLALIAAMLGAFGFWQLRLRYADLCVTRGARAAGAALLGSLATLALAGGAGTSIRLLRRLRRTPPGPAWLALPAPARELVRLQAWEAELPMRVLAVPALAAIVAAARLADPVAWVTGALTFPIAWIGCCRAGAWVAQSLTASRAGDDGAALAARAEAWSVGSPGRARPRDRAGTWRRMHPVLALAAKDLRLAVRSRAPRTKLALALAVAVASVALWGGPAPVRGLAFAGALVAIAAFGEWLVVLGASDPFAVLRSLPVRAGSIWTARMLIALTALAALLAAHALASGAGAPVLRLSLTWLAVAGVAIFALAIQLQLTLYPRHEPALRLFGLMLVLALVCSLMIPLLGWVVLLAAVVHSSRRLSRWWRLEDLA